MLPNMTIAELPLLESDDWFGALPAARRRLIVGQARVRTVATGELVYAADDPPNGLWAVLEGQVRLIGHLASGVDLLALILRPGTWFGELSTMDGRPRPHDAIAYGPTRLLHLSQPVFNRLAADEPGLYRDIGLLVCAHQRTALAFIAQGLSQSVTTRLARTLLQGAEVSGSDVLNIRQSDLAGTIGVSRQTLNKELQRLCRAGLVDLAYARITLRDRKGLAAIGDD
jgi:CRP/FNR family cyclic AMP-dependent transcriptional regulator